MAVAIFAAFLPACYQSTSGYTACPTKLFYLKQSTPNELGDTLAGFAGALAFIWIVVTVAMQSLELKAQREELALTREEMSGQRIATQEMARAMAAQASIFEDEKQHRLEDRTAELVEQKLQALGEKLEIFKDSRERNKMYWVFNRQVKVRQNDGSFREGEEEEKRYVFQYLNTMNLEDLIKSSAKSSREFLQYIDRKQTNIEILSIGRWQEDAFLPMSELLAEIVVCSEKLSAGEKQRLSNLGIFSLNHHLTSILNITKTLIAEGKDETQ